jgi:hypothetical protein
MRATLRIALSINLHVTHEAVCDLIFVDFYHDNRKFEDVKVGKLVNSIACGSILMKSRMNRCDECICPKNVFQKNNGKAESSKRRNNPHSCFICI